jgi:hypothetical protein
VVKNILVTFVPTPQTLINFGLEHFDFDNGNPRSYSPHLSLCMVCNSSHLAQTMPWVCNMPISVLSSCNLGLQPKVRVVINVFYVATLALGLRPRQRGCKAASQVGDPGALHMLPGVQRMWGNEPSHSQVNSHVGELESRKDSWIFRAQLQGSNLLASKSSLYHWKAIEV